MKYIVIVGASSGIGRAVAEAFARGGWRVGVTARREEPLRELSEAYPGRIEYAAFDMAAENSDRHFLDLVERLGGMDIMLYAAGCGWYNPGLDTTDDVRTVATNVTGFTRIVNASFLYYSRTANVTPGRIAAITSVAGVKGLGISAAYSASKRYQWTYLQAIDQLAHIRHVNVGVTDIRPGFIQTRLLDRGPRDLPLTMPLDYAVGLIVKALMRGRRVVTIDSRWAVVSALWRLIPDALWPHLSVFNPPASADK